MQVDTDQHIPPELYRAVAEVLVWLHRMEQEKL
jgi:flagellar biosynthesis protein